MEHKNLINDEIKQELLELGEKLSKDAVDTIFKIIEIAIKDSSTPIDDLTVLPVLPTIKNFVLKYVDKIDGKEG